MATAKVNKIPPVYPDVTLELTGREAFTLMKVLGAQSITDLRKIQDAGDLTSAEQEAIVQTFPIWSVLDDILNEGKDRGGAPETVLPRY